MVDRTTDVSTPAAGGGTDLRDAGERLTREGQALSSSLSEAGKDAAAQASAIGDRVSSRLGSETEAVRDEAAEGLIAFSDALKAASAELTEGAEVLGLDWWKEHGLKTRPFPREQWYLYPTVVERGLRFEMPYQERLKRIGVQLGRRLHESDMHWWDKQLEEYQALPPWKDFPGLWEASVAKAGGQPADYPFWLVTARSMQYAWGGNVGVQMIREVAGNVAGHNGVVMNPRAAERLGLAEGDLVDIATPRRATPSARTPHPRPRTRSTTREKPRATRTTVADHPSVSTELHRPGVLHTRPNKRTARVDRVK